MTDQVILLITLNVHQCTVSHFSVATTDVRWCEISMRSHLV